MSRRRAAAWLLAGLWPLAGPGRAHESVPLKSERRPEATRLSLTESGVAGREGPFSAEACLREASPDPIAASYGRTWDFSLLGRGDGRSVVHHELVESYRCLALGERGPEACAPLRAIPFGVDTDDPERWSLGRSCVHDVYYIRMIAALVRGKGWEEACGRYFRDAEIDREIEIEPGGFCAEVLAAWRKGDPAAACPSMLSLPLRKGDKEEILASCRAAFPTRAEDCAGQEYCRENLAILAALRAADPSLCPPLAGPSCRVMLGEGVRSACAPAAERVRKTFCSGYEGGLEAALAAELKPMGSADPRPDWQKEADRRIREGKASGAGGPEEGGP